jgi:hypothetical protein
MSELKEIYAIDWMGPYDSVEEIKDREGSEECCIYLITGRLFHNGPLGIRYVGITKRFVGNRLCDKDHLQKQAKIKNKQFWAGRFSVSRYNNLVGWLYDLHNQPFLDNNSLVYLCSFPKLIDLLF